VRRRFSLSMGLTGTRATHTHALLYTHVHVQTRAHSHVQTRAHSLPHSRHMHTHMDIKEEKKTIEKRVWRCVYVLIKQGSTHTTHIRTNTYSSASTRAKILTKYNSDVARDYKGEMLDCGIHTHSLSLSLSHTHTNSQ